MKHAVSSEPPAAVDALSLPDEALSPDAAIRTPNETIGRVNTPASVARWMVREALGAICSSGKCRELTIVEPAAGSGVIVAALIEKFAASGPVAQRDPDRALRSIWAIDSDPHVRPLAGRRLQMLLGRSPAAWLQRQYRTGDSLIDARLLPKKPIDLIIGNPPYLGLRYARRLPNFDKWQQRFGVREDLYALFMRWAMQVVRPGGHVALLVPDTWLSLAGYEDLRKRILQGRLRLIVRLPADTFDRQVFPCFFVWEKASPTNAKVRYIDARGAKSKAFAGAAPPTTPPISALATTPRVVPQSLFEHAPQRIIFVPTPDACETAERWRLLTAPTARVATLANIARIADVGIHSRNCRHNLFFATREKPGLQRLLQGRQIQPYAILWNSPKARYRWVDTRYAPKPGVRGRRGNGLPSVRDEYWDWQGDPAIHRLPERILIRQTGDRIVAARCLQGRVAYYTDNTLFTATLTDAARSAGLDYLCLLAYLNSAIATRLYRFLSGEHGRPQAQIKIGLLRRLPFIRPTPASIARIGGLIRQIEHAAARGAATAAQQKAINSHFEQLFARAVKDILSRRGERASHG
jgi:hypothetical protein